MHSGAKSDTLVKCQRFHDRRWYNGGVSWPTTWFILNQREETGIDTSSQASTMEADRLRTHVGPRTSRERRSFQSLILRTSTRFSRRTGTCTACLEPQKGVYEIWEHGSNRSLSFPERAQVRRGMVIRSGP